MSLSSARAARGTVAVTKAGPAPVHNRVPADPAEFRHLDLPAYDAFREEMRAHGFRHLADYEAPEETGEPGSAAARTFIRAMVSREGNVVARYCQIVRAKGLLGGLLNLRMTAAPAGFAAALKMRHCVDLETEFDNGRFIVTSKAETAAQTAAPPGIESRFFPLDTPVDALLDEHYRRLVCALKRGGARPVAVSTRDQMHRAQHRLNALRQRAAQETPAPAPAAARVAVPPASPAPARAASPSSAASLAPAASPLPVSAARFMYDIERGQQVSLVNLSSWAGYSSDNSHPDFKGSCVLLRLRADDDGDLAEPHPAHHAAVRWLLAHEQALHDAIAAALARFASTLGQRLEARGDEASLRLLRAPGGWKQLIGLSYIDVFPHLRDGMPYLAFEFGCNWDVKRGLKLLTNGLRVIAMDDDAYSTRHIVADGGAA